MDLEGCFDEVEYVLKRGRESRGLNSCSSNDMGKSHSKTPSSEPLSQLNFNTFKEANNHFATDTLTTPKRIPIALKKYAYPNRIQLVASETLKQRENDIANALGIISQSIEPPQHCVDKYRDVLLKELDEVKRPQRWYWKLSRHFLDISFFRIRIIWHYVVLMSPLFYNLGLLFSLFFCTPPLGLFAIGFCLYWVKIVYELYRDVVHRDDLLYRSKVPMDLSILAAISAGIGLVLRVKAESGDISTSWIKEFWHSSTSI